MGDIWRQAAAYLTAIESCAVDCSEADFNAKMAEVGLLSNTEIKRCLRALAGQGLRAAHMLLDEDLCWTLRPMKLSRLEMRGGGDSDNFVSRLLQEFKSENKRLWTVAEAAECMRAVPEEDRDVKLRAYFSDQPIPTFRQSLIVGTECGIWRVGDGYHRGVILYNAGHVDVTCFAGSE